MSEKLNFLLQHDAQTDTVHLEYSDINDLNGLMSDLRSFPNLRELYIHGNRLTSIPPDMSGLKRLEKIDIRGNPFKDIPDVASALSTLPNLKHLFMTLKAEADEDALFSFLPKLETINGTSIPQLSTELGAERDAASGMEATAITEQEFDAVVDLFEQIAALQPSPTSSERFDAHADVVMGQLDNDIAALVDERDDFMRQNLALHARSQLYGVCWDEMIDQMEAHGAALVAPLRDLRRATDDIVNKYKSLVKTQYSELQSQLGAKAAEAEVHERETTDMFKGVEEMERQFREREEALKADWERERRQLLQELASVKSGVPSGTVMVRAVSPGASQTVVASPEFSTQSLPKPKPGGRELTQKQLQDFITELYASKVKYDAKCREAKLPRETMEQHLYTYLNQKYGLKSLIIEWASAVMAAVKKFSDDDNDVAVFGKILRNEIDEEFRIVQKQLKDTVAELLRVYLKGKYPLKSEDEVSKLLKKRIAASVYEEEWSDIIKYMYNHEDSVTLIMKCKDLISLQAREEEANKPVRGRGRAAQAQDAKESTKMAYSDFLKVLLDFQLKGHEKFLLKFMKLFRQFDKDKNGVINEEEFRQLIIATDPNKTDLEIQDLLNLVDPHNNQQISFSECVNFLSSDLVHMTA
jgi:hypothetical protein